MFTCHGHFELKGKSEIVWCQILLRWMRIHCNGFHWMSPSSSIHHIFYHSSQRRTLGTSSDSVKNERLEVLSIYNILIHCTDPCLLEISAYGLNQWFFHVVLVSLKLLTPSSSLVPASSLVGTECIICVAWSSTFLFSFLSVLIRCLCIHI